MIRSIGTIKNRHTMPVERYLIEDDVSPGKEAYEKAYESAKKLAIEIIESATLKTSDQEEVPIKEFDTIDLYYTGLTESLIGALDAFENFGMEYRLMRYDSVSKNYEPIERKREYYEPGRWKFMEILNLERIIEHISELEHEISLNLIDKEELLDKLGAIKADLELIALRWEKWV